MGETEQFEGLPSLQELTFLIWKSYKTNYFH